MPGRRWRDSWRRLERPWSLPKDALDLVTLWLLEKLLLDGSYRLLNIMGESVLGLQVHRIGGI